MAPISHVELHCVARVHWQRDQITPWLPAGSQVRNRAETSQPDQGLINTARQHSGGEESTSTFLGLLVHMCFSAKHAAAVKPVTCQNINLYDAPWHPLRNQVVQL